MVVNNWEVRARRVLARSWQTVTVNWHLGFTSFGGPPVHFKIFHDKFVVKLKWIDEQLYQELFSVCQAISGPASTKMLYCVNLIHGGTLSAILALLIWCLPGACGMLGLSIGVSTIGDSLPRAVYALLSGLNAATVGIIALAAVELSNKAITDKLTRMLVFLAASAGMLYTALWYFPVLMFGAGLSAVVYDKRWLHRPVKAVMGVFTRNTEHSAEVEHGMQEPTHAETSTEEASATAETEPRVVPQEHRLDFSWKIGTAIIIGFFLAFTPIVTLRALLLPSPPFLFKLFANLLLAGTIIFGGGPVVIPLLREYIVSEGWVKPRDFLIGLAVAQAFPGPNFNFAVFLGGLAALGNGHSVLAGAVVAFLGIFLPGIVLVHGLMGVWEQLRAMRWVKSGVRGVNAAAVGLIYTAVYRIWQVGYIDEGFQAGRSLGDDPWWVVIAATSYVGGRYFAVSAPVAILTGAVLGLARYGVVDGK